MITNSNPEDRKRRLASHFNAVSSTYDALNFLQVTARRLVEFANLASGARILDVATGTGIIPLLSIASIGETGSVIGIDLSSDMLSVAHQKTAEAGLVNIQFQLGDAEKLDFPDGSFDVVLCASSLFFVPDMPAALKEARRVLAPNGYVVFNSFQPNFLQPLRELWSARLKKHDIDLGSLPVHRIPDAETCEQLLRDAGFTQIDVKVEQIGYYHPSAEDRWHEISAGLEGMPLKSMSPEQREQIHAEHVAELQSLMTPNGIWVDVPPMFAFGR